MFPLNLVQISKRFFWLTQYLSKPFLKFFLREARVTSFFFSLALGILFLSPPPFFFHFDLLGQAIGRKDEEKRKENKNSQDKY